ncbi:MAG: hypothetical protein HGA84_00605 [Syntrophobacteraceae bacterium]|nr:hypothetical protein [Syntrophobacteraceae bacterium]
MASACLTGFRFRRFGAVLFLCAHFLVAGPASGQAGNLSGRWEATYFFNRIVVDMEHSGPSVHGVMVLHDPSGDLSTYHFEGSFIEGRLEARHHSGHAFSGELRENVLTGTLTMKTGEKYPVHVTDFRRTP